jgi:hypothetical protein
MYLFSWCAYVPLALQAQGWLSGVPGWLHLAAGIVGSWQPSSSPLGRAAALACANCQVG